VTEWPVPSVLHSNRCDLDFKHSTRRAATHTVRHASQKLYSDSTVTRCGVPVAWFPVAGKLRCEPFCPASMVKATALLPLLLPSRR